MKETNLITSHIIKGVAFGLENHINPWELELIVKNENVGIELGRRMAVQMRMHIGGEELGKVTFKYPDGWFQALKEKHFPDFLLKKFPVKYVKKVVTATALYPHIEKPVRGEPYHTFLEINDSYSQPQKV